MRLTEGILRLTLSDETASTVDTRRVELHELKILQGQAGTRNHRVTVTRASVRTRAAEVRSPVTTGGQDSLVCTEAVEGAILHVQRDDTNAFAVLHDEIECEVLDEEVGVVPEGLAVERVEESVPGTIRRRCAAVGLATLAVLQRLTAESTLVDLALLRS